MPTQPITLEMVDAYFARKSRWVTFPAAIEKLYNEQMSSYRQKVMARNVLPTVLIYNTFLIADILLLPQSALLATFIHFAFVTPLIVLTAVLYPRIRNLRLREIMPSIIPLMMVCQIMYIYSINVGQGADQYQYLAIMTVIYMNINQRFGFRLAIISSALLVSVYLSVLLTGHSPFEVKFIGTCMMLGAANLSLMANRRIEYDVRFGFLKRLQERLRRESAEAVAMRDPMTGLANRRRLDHAIADLWAGCTDETAQIAVVMIDVDHFKEFNDRHGHTAGDVCLKRVAGAISSELRNNDDLAVRFGGEEFVLLLPNTDMRFAVRLAERLRQQIENLAIPNEEAGPYNVITASFGVSAGPVMSHNFTELLSGADAALYAAKRNGRNQVWPPFLYRDTPFAQPQGVGPKTLKTS